MSETRFILLRFDCISNRLERKAIQDDDEADDDEDDEDDREDHDDDDNEGDKKVVKILEYLSKDNLKLKKFIF